MSKWQISAPYRESDAKEQQTYASILDRSAKTGFGVLATVFVAYFFDLWPALTPLEEINKFWSYSLNTYLSKSGAPVGWQWVDHLHHGDFASLACVAFLAACSLPCLLSVMVIYARRKERLFATICALEIAVLILSASGILTTD